MSFRRSDSGAAHCSKPMSERFELSKVDVRKWLWNLVIFLLPVLLVYLAFVQGALQDGFDGSDFVPTREVVGAMILFVVNALTDIVRKFLTSPK